MTDSILIVYHWTRLSNFGQHLDGKMKGFPRQIIGQQMWAATAR
ncbi:hypothetical protein AB4Y40_34755 [Paraburkholderia sp. EG287B]